MENSNLELAAAISEVGRGYDIIKQLQGLLQLKSRKGQDAVQMQELAEPLFRDGLQALNHALCILKSGVSKVEIKSENVMIESGSPVHSSGSVVCYESDQRIENGRGKKRRVGGNSWITNTTMPYDDGYQWRKYGDKKISGTNFSRSYFRCTYKEEQGCQAKKLVQQTSDKLDMPFFQVTYTNKHTCSSQKTRSPSPIPQISTFGSIELQDNSINEKLHLQESIPITPRQLNQASCFGDLNLRDIIRSVSMNERNCEWDLDSLLRDLVDFASYDCPL
ncbi:hypothetical protein LUZ61_001186 [Rhynchospora tenuis]|uniref:WRKY domain-containing protein n=1 Tax=Rhynchospora tenuis TaxID=198213 RepID=A0AAD6EQM4_9POAL|nr:hypothetical protein LUZ61_001186 [Rhynchospora tenuis]